MSRGFDGFEIDDFRESSSGESRDVDRTSSSSWDVWEKLQDIRREEERADRSGRKSRERSDREHPLQPDTLCWPQRVVRWEYMQRYRQASPKRILPGSSTVVANLGTPDSLREQIRKGEVAILGEIAPETEGISPDDDVLEPYLAPVEELDIPVAFHVLSGNIHFAPRNRAALNNPLLLEKMLIRHPKLRMSVMHAGWPMLDAMISLLSFLSSGLHGGGLD